MLHLLIAAGSAAPPARIEARALPATPSRHITFVPVPHGDDRQATVLAKWLMATRSSIAPGRQLTEGTSDTCTETSVDCADDYFYSNFYFFTCADGFFTCSYSDSRENWYDIRKDCGEVKASTTPRPLDGITPGDLKAALKLLFGVIADEIADEMFEMTDENGDGLICMGEYYNKLASAYSC